jgi:hypothetical protein
MADLKHSHETGGPNQGEPTGLQRCWATSSTAEEIERVLAAKSSGSDE